MSIPDMNTPAILAMRKGLHSDLVKVFQTWLANGILEELYPAIVQFASYDPTTDPKAKLGYVMDPAVAAFAGKLTYLAFCHLTAEAQKSPNPQQKEGQ